ncbi:unnamed protein product [Rotaria socialis]|uniref:Uncharacterized protein n=1 Tax=Rotaria socialis TaxID=392032 RepID=A0A817TKL7_9BILA|nr:unnamed protein product [Rotaria socialis]CAF4497778.1 unnamed protein product [Rotaria socialis]
MYILSQVLFFILLIISINSLNTNLLSDHVQPCLSRSMERIFLEYQQEKFDCSSLSSQIQIRLAIHFTFCHLNSTGINPKNICSLSSCDRNLNECLKNITKNSFAYLTYTNFVPHIQSICYAIETQQWHSHARDTVLEINRHTSQIEIETKQLLIEQETMQISLDQALVVNQDSVDDALSVDRFLQVAQSDVDELRGHLYTKDKAQIQLLQQILETLFNIQTSLFTDAFGLSSYFFYAISLIGIHLLTIPERTNDSKFWLILLWAGLIAIERYMLIFSSYSQTILYNALWRFRQLWFFVSCLTFSYHAVKYRNYYKENQKLIDEINRKHKKLEIAARKCLNVINQLNMTDDSISDDAVRCSSENNDTSTTSILTDEELK